MSPLEVETGTGPTLALADLRVRETRVVIRWEQTTTLFIEYKPFVLHSTNLVTAKVHRVLDFLQPLIYLLHMNLQLKRDLYSLVGDDAEVCFSGKGKGIVSGLLKYDERTETFYIHVNAHVGGLLKAKIEFKLADVKFVDRDTCTVELGS